MNIGPLITLFIAIGVAFWLAHLVIKAIRDTRRAQEEQTHKPHPAALGNDPKAIAHSAAQGRDFDVGIN